MQCSVLSRIFYTDKEKPCGKVSPVQCVSYVTLIKVSCGTHLKGETFRHWLLQFTYVSLCCTDRSISDQSVLDLQFKPSLEFLQRIHVKFYILDLTWWFTWYDLGTHSWESRHTTLSIFDNDKMDYYDFIKSFNGDGFSLLINLAEGGDFTGTVTRVSTIVGILKNLIHNI